MTDVIDLNELVPQARYIKIQDKQIEIKPPKLINLLVLGSLGQKMQDVAGLTADEAGQLTDDLTREVKNCVPELDAIELNVQQLLKLVEIISEMGTPSATKELEKRGISPSSPKVG
jgi:hypothetical protein